MENVVVTKCSRCPKCGKLAMIDKCLNKYWCRNGCGNIFKEKKGITTPKINSKIYGKIIHHLIGIASVIIVVSLLFILFGVDNEGYNLITYFFNIIYENSIFIMTLLISSIMLGAIICIFKDIFDSVK